MKLEGFDNLEGLDCSSNQLTSNQLTSLELKDSVKLERLVCYNNKLTNLDFLKDLDGEKLKELRIERNNITSDLTPFSRFVNLEVLDLSNNPFHGSLKPLRDLTKLRGLVITDTDISHGLEYLPLSVERFVCSFTRPTARVSDI